MNKETVRARIQEIGIVPAIRLRSAEDALFAVKAVSHATIPELIVGAGTIFDLETAAPLPGRWR